MIRRGRWVIGASSVAVAVTLATTVGVSGQATKPAAATHVTVGSGAVEGVVAGAANDTVMDFAVGGPVARADPWKARLDFVEKAATAAAGTK